MTLFFPPRNHWLFMREFIFLFNDFFIQCLLEFTDFGKFAPRNILSLYNLHSPCLLFLFLPMTKRHGPIGNTPFFHEYFAPKYHLFLWIADMQILSFISVIIEGWCVSFNMGSWGTGYWTRYCNNANRHNAHSRNWLLSHVRPPSKVFVQ